VQLDKQAHQETNASKDVKESLLKHQNLIPILQDKQQKEKKKPLTSLSIVKNRRKEHSSCYPSQVFT
jgi:hypothetical protein